MVKLFKTPEYRLENMMLNKLPKNYDLNSSGDTIKMKTRQDLNYLYILLDERILIFKPNSKKFQNVKNLTFL
jgi:hypothetical protein